MKEIQPSIEISKMLKAFDAMGGVIEFILIDTETELPPNNETHRQAALFALTVLEQCERTDFIRLREEWPRRSVGMDQHEIERAMKQIIERTTHIHISQPERLQGAKIELKEFVGPYFDPQRAEFITERCWALDADVTQTNLTSNVPDTESYRYAFVDTPHGVGALDNMRVSKVFLALNEYFFSNFEASLDIYKWSTDWHEYFDAGHEFWGSFLWTVYNPQQKFIVVVAASTTD